MSTDNNCAMCYTVGLNIPHQCRYVYAWIDKVKLTQPWVVVTVLSVWPAMLLVAVVTGHRLQLDLFGQGREI